MTLGIVKSKEGVGISHKVFVEAFQRSSSATELRGYQQEIYFNAVAGFRTLPLRRPGSLEIIFLHLRLIFYVRY